MPLSMREQPLVKNKNKMIKQAVNFRISFPPALFTECMHGEGKIYQGPGLILAKGPPGLFCLDFCEIAAKNFPCVHHCYKRLAVNIPDNGEKTRHIPAL